MKQDFHPGIERRVKTLNKNYRSVILQVRFQNVGTVVVKVSEFRDRGGKSA
jgi:hypothetical protein